MICRWLGTATRVISGDMRCPHSRRAWVVAPAIRRAAAPPTWQDGLVQRGVQAVSTSGGMTTSAALR